MIIDLIILILNFYLYNIKNYILYLNQTSGVIIKMIELIWQILGNGLSELYNSFAMFYVQSIDLSVHEEAGMLDLGWTPPAK